MMKNCCLITLCLGLLGNTNAEHPFVGDYLCTVSEKASISSTHLENAGPPTAVIDKHLPTRFRMRISPVKHPKGKFQLTEINYKGTDFDQMSWHTIKSIFHGPYFGDGSRFVANDETDGVFSISQTRHANKDGDLSFYHSGFEWAGGDDTRLSIRWGRCKRG